MDATEDRAELVRVLRRVLTGAIEMVARYGVCDYMRDAASAELKRRETREVARYPHSQPERTE